jgi:hypothetical protein
LWRVLAQEIERNLMAWAAAELKLRVISSQ